MIYERRQRTLRILRTIALVLGIVIVGLAVLAFVGALVSVIIGVQAHNAGNRDTAGLAKLACVVCLSVGGFLAVPGLVFMIPGLVLHVIVRRLAMRGRCRKCGYDLRASHERCPECGTAIPPTMVRLPLT